MAAGAWIGAGDRAGAVPLGGGCLDRGGGGCRHPPAQILGVSQPLMISGSARGANGGGWRALGM